MQLISVRRLWQFLFYLVLGGSAVLFILPFVTLFYFDFKETCFHSFTFYFLPLLAPAGFLSYYSWRHFLKDYNSATYASMPGVPVFFLTIFLAGLMTMAVASGIQMVNAFAGQPHLQDRNGTVQASGIAEEGSSMYAIRVYYAGFQKNIVVHGNKFFKKGDPFRYPLKKGCLGYYYMR